jgi:phosphohistidine phosphatase
MQRLILLRHGEAEPRAASGRDIDRALTAHGKVEAHEAGERLAAAGMRPDMVLVSAARRAKETWAEAALSLAGGEVAHRPDLYAAPLDAILAAAEAEPADTVLVVAHNPGLLELALALAPQADALRIGLPTAAFVGLDRREGEWTLVEFSEPEVSA